MRVNEIFYSLQGEGRYTGTPAVFVRLSGCNEKCSFCDTDHLPFKEMSEDDVVEEVCSYSAHHVVITGGEPTLQLTASLCEKLHSKGLYVQIETNGSLLLPDNCRIDWVTCSPKSLPVRIQQVDELKVLFPFAEGKEEYLCQLIPVLREKKSDIELRLQPLDTGDAMRNKRIIADTIDYILNHPEWKMSLQTHKMLDIR